MTSGTRSIRKWLTFIGRHRKTIDHANVIRRPPVLKRTFLFSEKLTNQQTRYLARAVYTTMGMAPEKAMKDDPNEIAEQLIKEHGLQDAKALVMDGIAEAHESGGLYELSVWRDVMSILNEQ